MRGQSQSLDIRNPRGSLVKREYLPAGPDNLPRAAIGPNYGLGPPEYAPQIILAGLESGRVVQVAANWGLRGGYDRPLGIDTQRVLGQTGNFGDRNQFPAPFNNDNRPQWNVLPPQLTYGLQVITAKQVAALEVALQQKTILLPVQFPGVQNASLGK